MSTPTELEYRTSEYCPGDVLIADQSGHPICDRRWWYIDEHWHRIETTTLNCLTTTYLNGEVVRVEGKSVGWSFGYLAPTEGSGTGSGIFSDWRGVPAKEQANA